jgi:hypothetical protein
MSALFVRTALPVATSLAAALFLVIADPGFSATAAMPGSLALAEVQHCMADGRNADACLDEVDAKAFVEQADDASRRGAGR